MTQKDQERVQLMMNGAFEKRMKKEIFPNDEVSFIKGQFLKVLLNFGFNTINIKSNELREIAIKGEDFSYFEIGTMLNCIMSASFEKNGIVNNISNSGITLHGISGVADFIARLEPIQDVYNDFVAKCRKAAQSEVKTKLKIAGDPIANYIQ